MLKRGSFADHFPAFFRAAPAFFCATRTVLHILVFLTFFCTCIANFRTRLTKKVGMCSAHAHQLGRRTAHQCTLPVNFDASGQLFNIVLVKALCGTVLAFGCACLACVNTALESFVTHRYLDLYVNSLPDDKPTGITGFLTNGFETGLPAQCQWRHRQAAAL